MAIRPASHYSPPSLSQSSISLYLKPNHLERRCLLLSTCQLASLISCTQRTSYYLSCNEEIVFASKLDCLNISSLIPFSSSRHVWCVAGASISMLLVFSLCALPLFHNNIRLLVAIRRAQPYGSALWGNCATRRCLPYTGLLKLSQVRIAPVLKHGTVTFTEPVLRLVQYAAGECYR